MCFVRLVDKSAAMFFAMPYALTYHGAEDSGMFGLVVYQLYIEVDNFNCTVGYTFVF
jgi:hypothetical protein